tara:strand:- start:12519 stop:12740 length:222 start_codon:yes stop_codon:yes gene_type:complete
MAETITIRGEGITLDLLLWRRHGVRGRELVASSFAANPGLAEKGPFLPLGTVVSLPEMPKRTSAARKVVSLFD